jgi:hypothetical protein
MANPESWEQRKHDLIGGERKGKDIAGQQIWNEGLAKQSPDNAARGRVAEGSFVETATAEQQTEQVKSLQARIAKNSQDIEGYNTSLKAIDASLEAGKKLVAEKPGMAGLNETLAAEALKQQQALLAAKEALIRDNQESEGKIISMAH